MSDKKCFEGTMAPNLPPEDADGDALDGTLQLRFVLVPQLPQRPRVPGNQLRGSQHRSR